MNVVVCDEENATRKEIKKYIMAEDKEVHICEVPSAEELFAIEKMDMLFLDTEFEDMSGIEAARKLRSQGTKIPIVFVTAIRDHVFEAFDVQAFQYLMKPLDKEKIGYVFNKAKQTVLREQRENEKVLRINTKKKNYTIKENQVLYAENDGKRIILHTISEVVVLYGTMRMIEEKLGTTRFYRCHRGYLVNMGHIAGYSRDSIQLDNGETIFLARGKYSEFVARYEQFVN